MEFQKIVTEVDFNWPEDKEEFGCDDRVVSLNRFNDEENQDVLGITFKLGRKEDDSISLVLPYKEFAEKLGTLTTECG